MKHKRNKSDTISKDPNPRDIFQVCPLLKGSINCNEDNLSWVQSACVHFRDFRDFASVGHKNEIFMHQLRT